jgi:pyrrolidone-carboxylate peptidase
VDKNLIGSFRIEQCAEKDGTHLVTNLDLKSLAEKLSSNGIKSTISKTPTHYLCNEAYWHLLEKYQGKAVLIHIPTIKNFNNIFEDYIMENFIDLDLDVPEEIKEKYLALKKQEENNN